MQGSDVPELELASGSPPWWLSFMVPKDITQASKGGKQPIILPGYDSDEPQHWRAWHSYPYGYGAAVASRLTGLKIQLPREKSGLEPQI